jgi:hypothetical protein
MISLNSRDYSGTSAPARSFAWHCFELRPRASHAPYRSATMVKVLSSFLPRAAKFFWARGDSPPETKGTLSEAGDSAPSSSSGFGKDAL